MTNSLDESFLCYLTRLSLVNAKLIRVNTDELLPETLEHDEPMP